MISMVAAYVLIWTALFLYIVSIYMRQKKLSKEIESLKNLTKEREA